MKRNQIKKLTAVFGAIALSLTAFSFGVEKRETASADYSETALIGDGSKVSFASSGLSKVAGNACNTGASDAKYRWFEGKDDSVSDLPDGYLYGVVDESTLPTGGKDGGVKLYIHFWDTETIRINFGKTVSIDEADGMSVKAYFGISDSIAQGTFYLCSEDSTGEAGDCVSFDLSTFAQNEWVDLILEKEALEVLANDSGTIDSLIVGYATTGGDNRSPYGYMFFDEISVTTKCAVTLSYGNGQNDGTVYAFKGETLAYPTAPSRNGYVFGGWYENGKLFDFSLPLSGETTLVAAWTEKSNDDLVGAYKNEDGSKYISLNADGRVEFSGVLAENGTYEVGQDAIVVEANTVYTVERTADGLLLDGEPFVKTDDVTLRYYDDDALVRTIVYPKDAVITPLALPSTESKKFEGWKKKGRNEAYDFSAPLTENADFYASYEMRYLNVEEYDEYFGYYYGETEKTVFILSEDSATMVKKGVETVGDYTIFTDGSIEIVIEGRKFSGEAIRDGLELNGRTYKKLGDYTLTFSNGGYSTAVTVKAGEKVTLPTVPTREGYTFEGWVTTDGESFDANSVVFRSETLIAKWSKTEEKSALNVVLPVIVGVEAVAVLVVAAFVVRKFLKKGEE